MLKILYVTRVPTTAVHFVLPLAKRMREHGHTVEFAFGPGAGLSEMDASGFPYTMLSMEKMSRSPANFRVIRQLSEIMRKGQYDVIHTYSPVIGLYGRLAANKAGRPLVIHSVIGSLLASGVPYSHRLLFVASELATSHMVDLFITLNDADAMAMVKYRLASAEKVVSLKYEYGVNLNDFNPEAVDRRELEEVRTKLGLKKGTPVIGFVGRMIADKGILDLFEAYRIIRANGVKAKLLYVGDVLTTDKDQQTFEKLRELVRKAGFEDDVIFRGAQDNVPLNISLMDVVVHPSHHEGFPRIPVEAGAMGKPSVCTAVSGAEVAVEQGKTGFIVPIKDPERLAAAIMKVITDFALALSMGEKARQRVLEFFDENKIVDSQMDIYEKFFMKRKGVSILNPSLVTK